MGMLLGYSFWVVSIMRELLCSMILLCVSSLEYDW
jgi:hypothetical protein